MHEGKEHEKAAEKARAVFPKPSGLSRRPFRMRVCPNAAGHDVEEPAFGDVSRQKTMERPTEKKRHLARKVNRPEDGGAIGLPDQQKGALAATLYSVHRSGETDAEQLGCRVLFFHAGSRHFLLSCTHRRFAFFFSRVHRWWACFHSMSCVRGRFRTRSAFMSLVVGASLSPFFPSPFLPFSRSFAFACRLLSLRIPPASSLRVVRVCGTRPVTLARWRVVRVSPFREPFAFAVCAASVSGCSGLLLSRRIRGPCHQSSCGEPPRGP